MSVIVYYKYHTTKKQYVGSQGCIQDPINLFVPNAPFLYPLKTCFQGVEKGCIRNKWVKQL